MTGGTRRPMAARAGLLAAFNGKPASHLCHAINHRAPRPMQSRRESQNDMHGEARRKMRNERTTKRTTNPRTNKSQANRSYTNKPRGEPNVTYEFADISRLEWIRTDAFGIRMSTFVNSALSAHLFFVKFADHLTDSFVKIIRKFRVK